MSDISHIELGPSARKHIFTSYCPLPFDKLSAVTKRTFKKGSCSILLCGDDSYYTGITHALQQRLQEHLSGSDSLWLKFAQPYCDGWCKA